MEDRHIREWTRFGCDSNGVSELAQVIIIEWNRRAKMYGRFGRLQCCWAHLIRDFQAMIDGGNAQTKRLGYDLRRAAKTLFRHRTDYRNAAISWAAVQRRLAPVRRDVERLLRRV